MYTATGPHWADGKAQTSPQLLHKMIRINNKLYAKHIPSMNSARAGLLLSASYSSLRVATCHFFYRLLRAPDNKIVLCSLHDTLI